MKQIQAILIGVCLSFALVLADITYSQTVENAQQDLIGENFGDSIALQWNRQDGGAEYILYRALAIDGTWQEVGRATDMVSDRNRVDVTSDARLRDLCYKVEAIDTSGIVIRIYQPICVPKYQGP